eukprot:TRINITY_DN2319_c0_g1_i3.p1 TRINITY_DN2319_c0_g1~~TRINITY_DN2319_c0_g1_i3.p1  ORF type:complete len:262 (+),score=-5.87 TRINITY_DN2319_c0_g1_i3:713-1498(+)
MISNTSKPAKEIFFSNIKQNTSKKESEQKFLILGQKQKLVVCFWKLRKSIENMWNISDYYYSCKNNLIVFWASFLSFSIIIPINQQKPINFKRSQNTNISINTTHRSNQTNYQRKSQKLIQKAQTYQHQIKILIICRKQNTIQLIKLFYSILSSQITALPKLPLHQITNQKKNQNTNNEQKIRNMVYQICTLSQKFIKRHIYLITNQHLLPPQMLLKLGQRAQHTQSRTRKKSQGGKPPPFFFQRMFIVISKIRGTTQNHT